MDAKLPFKEDVQTEPTNDRKRPAESNHCQPPSGEKKIRIPLIPEDILGGHVARLALDRDTYEQICLISPEVKQWATGNNVFAPWNELTELPTVTRPNIRRYADRPHRSIVAIPHQFSPAGHHLVCRLQDLEYHHNKDCYGIMVVCQQDPKDEWYCPDVTDLLPPFTWSIIQDERLVMDYAISEGDQPDFIVAYNCGQIWISTLKKQAQRLKLQDDVYWI